MKGRQSLPASATSLSLVAMLRPRGHKTISLRWWLCLDTPPPAPEGANKQGLLIIIKYSARLKQWAWEEDHVLSSVIAHFALLLLVISEKFNCFRNPTELMRMISTWYVLEVHNDAIKARKSVAHVCMSKGKLPSCSQQKSAESSQKVTRTLMEYLLPSLPCWCREKLNFLWENFLI